MTFISLRYDLRLPAIAEGSATDRYRAAIDQCAWADTLGIPSVAISEHHGAEDGFMCSPLVMAGAIAARTERIMTMVQAMLFPLHDPVRLAEDMATVAILSGGRFAVVAGLGYRQEEFDAFGVNRKRRARIVEEHIDIVRRLWAGEEVEVAEGRRARISPLPPNPPMLFVGGSTEAGARRAARLRCPFLPAIGDPELKRIYDDACVEDGWSGGMCILPNGPGFVHVTEDPERDWDRIAPFALHEAQTYASWQTPDQRSQVHVEVETLGDLKKSDVYWVVTPDECVERARALGPTGAVVLHPLMGGMPIDLGWESLHLFVDKVLPRL